MEAASEDLVRLRQTLGAPFVDAMLDGAGAAGTHRLPGDEDPTFGFVQRVLTHLDRAGRGLGLIFPKRDGTTYVQIFDFCDATGAIWVLHKGEGRGGLQVDPGWFREVDLGDPDRTYHELTPGAPVTIVVRFMQALASLRPPG